MRPDMLANRCRVDVSRFTHLAVFDKKGNEVTGARSSRRRSSTDNPLSLASLTPAATAVAAVAALPGTEAGRFLRSTTTPRRVRSMRFLYGAFFGSLVATALGTTICSAWFKPAVESYPEFKRVCEDKFHVEQERDQLRRQLIELATKRELDALRRAQRDPVNPAGPVVPAEDRIPAPQVPWSRCPGR
jgi:hypothetical protein